MKMLVLSSGSSRILMLIIGVLLLVGGCLGDSGIISPEEAVENHVGNGVCHRLMERIYHRHVVTPQPPEITGEWFSGRCEVRPGPEYILRKYKFNENSIFEVHQYYYADIDCSEALFSIVARGQYEILYPSWTMPGATEVDYQLSYVTVMPYTNAMAYHLSRRMNKTCPEQAQGHGTWMPFQRYELFNYVEYNSGKSSEDGGYIVTDKDCTEALDFTLHELQLMRVEERKHHRGVERSLYLGDIHTDRKQRQMYRPTSYQDPLYFTGSHGCPVCDIITKSDDYYPPTLHRRHPEELPVSGEWFSERCEARPQGTFLTRRLLFSENNITWEGYYYHYTDGLCREPYFTLYARGSYVAGPKSPIIPRAQHFDFKVMNLRVKPQDQRIVSMLNENVNKDCGELGSWELGVEQDVSSSGGCGLLGITTPHVEYEILRLEKEHGKAKLYLGQRPSDGSHPSTPSIRPTSFQTALIRCGKGDSLANSIANMEEHSYKALTDSGGKQQGGGVLITLTLLCLGAYHRL